MKNKIVGNMTNSELIDFVIELQEEYEKFLKGQEKLLHAYEELEQKNKLLKEKMYLCTPEIPQNGHNNYVSYVDLVNKLCNVEKENKELKKQIEEYKEIIGDVKNEN